MTLSLLPLLDRLATARVACVGDVMLDRFVDGVVDRISPEAPIPVLSVRTEQAMLGGAGNVVRNLAALGAETCFVAVIGDDAAGREVIHLVGREPTVEPHLMVEPGRATTIKTRFIAGRQQLLRADRETVRPLGEDRAADLVSRTLSCLDDCRVLVLSDYGKGVLQPSTVADLISAARARGLTVMVDPKGRDFGRYAGADLLTPNRKELVEATGLPATTDEEVVAAARAVLDSVAVSAVLVTRSQDGMTLVPREGQVYHFSAEARAVIDVSGAGDTVIATIAAGLAAGVELPVACHLASIAAGLVVAKPGTATASANELAHAIRAVDALREDSKVATRAEAMQRVADWRAAGLAVGFTNGCFDLLHPGHVSLLAEARSACDRLVVGLNSDDSVKRLKGPERPIQTEHARAVVLASLSSVDLVVPFADDTPIDLITTLKPDVLVKGADYTVETVVGASDVIGWGGRVVLAGLVPGQSTTGIAQRLRNPTV
ncbi:MAG: D-glycero-beta-D-manno-heptose-7-phosphate kinase [Alphaproteobacteria bacterium]|nr:MAG: D-glycero-beta-D-manno-heptose-7-phosphate kinase [Alphaproteobacteria bacterium]